MSKSLMDTATFWEITKHPLYDKHDNDTNISLVIDELDEMITQTIRNAIHISQRVSFSMQQKEESNNDQ
ncbi:hypothetical protein M5U04_18535 [Xenorhabdus sp. XENO-1]|uniref:hypothetical protein n=1 Tax=Xenorhabdus bovienii TaxID=40576 RepID=UPI0020CA5031|nr:hypothetical protein [Xenorhabdus bovienii]MCP9270022.1 hypothetical protein [Xenorhabdus bovienii subsp. africana]